MPPKTTPKRKSKEEWVRDAESGILRHPSLGIFEKEGILSVHESEFQLLDYLDAKRIRIPFGTPFLLLSPSLMKALLWKFGSRVILIDQNVILRVWPSDGSYPIGISRETSLQEKNRIKVFNEPLHLAKRIYFKIDHQKDESFLFALKSSLEATEILTSGSEHSFTYYGKIIDLKIIAINELKQGEEDGSFICDQFESLRLSSTPKQSKDKKLLYYSFAWNETELIFLNDASIYSQDRTPLEYLIGGLDSVIHILKKAIASNDHRKKGILLFGPPGSGKTLIGERIGDTLGYRTISVAASDIYSKFYGETESKLKDIFNQASSHEGKEGTILFIDDFDSLCPRRSDNTKTDQEKRVLSGLIHMLDKHRESKNLVVLGATSRIDSVDPTLRRPNRFDYEVEISVPSPQEREQILNCVLKLKNVKVDRENVLTIANKTHGYVGADLESLVNESLNISEEEKVKDPARLELRHFMSAFKKIRPSAMREVSIQVPDVSWEDIGGLTDLKLKLKQAVEWPLKKPEVFARLGIKPPKGILIGLNFMAVKGPELFSKWVGESERAVRELFRKARAVAPSIIFFDEIDSLCGSRGGSGDSKVSDRVLAQLLTEMDGVEVLNSVTIVAATNRPDMIDKALMRPGRLDRVIYVPLPDILKELAECTKGYSGAEISAVCTEAALRALERDINSKIVTEQDFHSALRIITPRIHPDLLNIYSDFQASHQRSGIIVAHVLKKPYTYDNSTTLDIGSGLILNNSASIARQLARGSDLYEGDIIQKRKLIIEYLDQVLEPATYLVGNKITIADYTVYGFLFMSGLWRGLLQDKKAPIHVKRWYDFIGSKKEVVETLKDVPSNSIPKATTPKTKQDHQSTRQQKSSSKSSEKKEDVGKFVDLPGAEMGKVIVRFPPEASGYLHVGHAKACLLNQHYRDHFQGKLILRFDDTNPAKEKEEFENVILEDLKLLKVKYDYFSRTSDHFETMLNYCEKMIKEETAYVDDTDAETMKAERETRTESKNRSNTVEKNMNLWKEMKAGTDKGISCCVRAKINMLSDNGCMRDPTIYRCKNEPHPSTGSKYKVYPTYDFACPIVDSIEGVTHALRTTEYMDRDEQFFWFINALGLRQPHIYAYSRLSLTNTVMSKRKLNVGSSRSVVFMEWDKIWAFNRKIIDPIAPRYTTVDESYHVLVNINGLKEESVEFDKHPKNSDVGKKTLWRSSKVIIDGDDAEALKENEKATFINLGNVMIRKIHKANGKVSSIDGEPLLDDKDYKKTLKVTWLANVSGAGFVPTQCVYFDHIISKSKLAVGDIIQVQRRGYFIVDKTYKEPSPHSCKGSPIVLIAIPDGTLGSYGRPKSINAIVTTSKPEQKSPKKAVNHSGSSSSNNVSFASTSEIKIRDLKAAKADKSAITQEVNLLLSLKAEFKSATGKDWKPDAAPKVEAKNTSSASDLDTKIRDQGNKIRDLKAAKADKSAITQEVNLLLSLKAEFKSATGKDWKPDAAPKVEAKNTSSASDLDTKIRDQGNKIRDLKAAKADKSAITQEVNLLLSLKAEFKSATGKDWKPDAAPKVEAKNTSSASDLDTKIRDQGNKIRDLKAAKADKSAITQEVNLLLSLKAEFKSATAASPNLGNKSDLSKQLNEDIIQQGNKAKYKSITGVDWKPSNPAPVPKPKKDSKKASSQLTSIETAQKQSRLGMEAKKEENLSDWYSQIIVKSGNAGNLTSFFDREIKKHEVQNCYFPMFVSKASLQKEEEHIDDFSPEVAWVTKSGDTEMAEPIAIRPTSETVMYPTFAKWIQSHRDLPLKINQWCNVVRWEFKHPQPFLRTREFLWQEGHTAHANMKDAKEEVLTMLDLYRQIYEDLMAVPVIRGKKTEKEKFAGGDFTTTVEAYISASGRAIQDPETGNKQYVYQNSWGFTTRTIGVLTMVHGDNQGLVLPPKISPVQVVIVPCGITANLKDEDRKSLYKGCEIYEKSLVDKFGVRVKGDYRENISPGWKFNHWELKGVPIRLELGPRDMKQNQFVVVRRDTGEKITCKSIEEVPTLLDTIQREMFAKAKKELDDHLTIARTWNEFMDALNNKNLIHAPFCGDKECEEGIKDKSKGDAVVEPGSPSMGAKSLCIPFNQVDQLKGSDKCLGCGGTPKYFTLFGRSY
ncbi:EPRS [Lepeophtheirus salmonis]|uniref:proline--tRNA ligase n=1 Tax=Lepeophtheirus salmonis TaxID=72036 RepID=A0A7R8D5X2_LEPSM|nr:EPRS [Lepeophtheirus salmonis]CAF3039695.1 EPRS [Lepeophtheirus salmonis]